MILKSKSRYRKSDGGYKTRKLRAKQAIQEKRKRERDALDEWFGR